MRHRTMGKRTRQGHSRIKQRTGGGTQREAKLNPKAHRRTSRREVRSTSACLDVLALLSPCWVPQPALGTHD